MNSEADLKAIIEMSLEECSQALLRLEFKKKNEVLSEPELFQLGYIYFNLKQYDQGFSIFETLPWKNYAHCAWLRRMVIAPLMRSKNFSWSASLLQLIVKNHPSSTTDLNTLSSVLIRQNKRAKACIYLQQQLSIEKENYALVAQLIQIKLQDNQLEEALQLAENYVQVCTQDERLLKIVFLTLSKAGKLQLCMKIIETLDFKKQPLDARIGLFMAKLKLTEEGKEHEALGLLMEAHKLEPENIGINNLLGDLLMKTGDYANALRYLEKIKKLLPENPHTRLLNARALKFTGNYEQAANEMLELVKLLPDSSKWKRYAASALVQAGRHHEAKDVFEQGILLRNKKLSQTFEFGLSQLWEKIDKVAIPQARFDWLWSMVNTYNSAEKNNRLAYEKLAKWVYLLDHFLIDWLECRPHQADEAMLFFKDLSPTYALLHEALCMNKGLILAGAHVGPLFCIPLGLELLGLPHKWLASTPSVSSMSYKDTLISTSENTQTEIVRQMMQSLHQGKIIALAIDGAISPSAPKIAFENQRITYSNAAAKISFKTQAPSFFIVSFWENGRFCLKLDRLPDPEEGENLQAFSARWTDSFLSALRGFLVEKPGNARLGGGIWRNIRFL